jgi:succinate dehydrogenase / fumarate reductase flavoprotein subunit
MAGRRFGKNVGSEVMEAWDVIVLGDGPAALHAAAEAAKEGANTLLMSATGLGEPGMAPLTGLSASLQESNNRSHREDTIRCGEFLSDQDMVSTTTAKAVKIVDLLERRGLNFRRDAQGLPMVRKALGHSQPRNVGAGSTTARELQQISEEQCMRHGVIRRGDQIPLTLVHNNQTVTGIIALDMVNGRVIGLQSKAVIIADEGFDGAYTSGISGLGMDMAFRAGVPLRDMEFVMKHPLVIKGTNLFLPLDLLSDGARVHEGSGAPIEVNTMSPIEACAAIEAAVQPVLDAREMGSNAAWWGSIFRLVQQRTGIDMNRQTVALEPLAGHTIGGLPVDLNGRCVVNTWARWFTGLYAAGDAACTGMHGAAALPGNRMLDGLCSGLAAGAHAGQWVKGRTFGSPDALTSSLEQSSADLSAMLGDGEGTHVVRCGTVMASVRAALAATSDYTHDSLSNLLTKLESASVAAESIHLDQASLIANTNLLEIFRTQASVRMLIASTQSGMARKESRGTFQRSDFESSNEDLLHHNTVDHLGSIGTLALKKGEGGHWVLPPQ